MNRVEAFIRHPYPGVKVSYNYKNQIKEKTKTIKNKLQGRKDFHIKCISWSYLNLGKEVLTQTKNIIKKLAFNPRTMLRDIYQDQPPTNNTENIKPVNIMWAYSAKKNKAKVIPGYSILNPDTSSDSPSVKSNGALFVSAIPEIKYIKPAGNKAKIKKLKLLWELLIILKSKEEERIIMVIKIKPRDTS